MRTEPIFFVGGASGGKSRLAQHWAESFIRETSSSEAHAPQCYFIATNKEQDPESAERIALHKAQRGTMWHTIDAPEDLMGAFLSLPSTAQVVLIDCVSLWLSNLCARGDSDTDILTHTEQWARHVQNSPIPVGIVSNEVGQGIVPLSALARRYRNIHGKVNQILAALCPTVLWVVCGLPQAIKGHVPHTLMSTSYKV